MLVSGALMAGIWQAAAIRNGREFYCRSGEGFGSAVFFSIGSMVLQLLVIGAGVTLYRLPAMVRQAGPAGLQPPNWLTSYEWAKPALMIMMFWLGVGSRNMLLYLAGLSNVPQDLYEAADIDGASQLQRFWHVTWPQLAPTTFFIVVMSVISGLQGGFDMVRTMTEGGPAGATTTLSYFIYAEGFETGRLGYSSAVAWTMFALILALTLINWKFGNRYVND
jgi:multiple sugar transport system permease protein